MNDFFFLQIIYFEFFLNVSTENKILRTLFDSYAKKNQIKIFMEI